MPKVSVIIPTHNRPELLRKTLTSVLAQTYQDFEVIVVDDGLLERSDKVIASFDDLRIKYIQHETERGGSAARNTGIRAASGVFIAFLDDDDEWLPKKLQIQMDVFENTPPDVGFCFSAVTNIKDGRKEDTTVPNGIGNYFARALARFSGVLTVTLIVKKYVFDDVGLFDEKFPSAQEAELVIRITKKYKGLGINKPLVMVDMSGTHIQIGSDIKRVISGREMLLEKHKEDFKKSKKTLAKQYFGLGLLYRDNSQFEKAQELFKKARACDHRPLYFLHGLVLIGGGKLYRLFRKTTS
jgi:glycosyltransferase involved in cell wall biosynthesis